MIRILLAIVFILFTVSCTDPVSSPVAPESPFVTTETIIILRLYEGYPPAPENNVSNENFIPTGWVKGTPENAADPMFEPTKTESLWFSTRFHYFINGIFANASYWTAPVEVTNPAYHHVYELDPVDPQP